MIMDPRFCGFNGSHNEIRLGNQSLPILQNQRFENGFFDQSREFGYLQSNLVPANNIPSSSVLTHEEEPSPEDCEFSDAILSYISQILMEEDMEDKTCMLKDSLDLQIAEKSFYEVIGEKYPSSSLGNPSPVDPYDGGGDNTLSDNYVSCSYNDGDLSSIFTNNSLRRNLGEPPNLNFQGNNSISKLSYSSSNRRKHHHREEGDVEENRSSKQAAIFSEPTLRTTMTDIILLYSLGDGKKHYIARREALQIKNDKIVLSNGKSKASNSGKGRGKKHNGKKEVVDLRTLLVLCAQTVAADDYKGAHELLKRIRQHSNLFGDGNQRLAHIFADGLEARLAGTGSQIYKGLVKNSARLHVIDFGILYGFQWPTLIQRLSATFGGKLRITGIDFPQPGFRPAERIIETGRRLAAYAESFKVPFEYNAIAKKWETIQLEELKIDRDEYLVVTCFYRGKNVLDESVVVDSPRNKFLSLVRKINPDLFIHGITNGAFNAPFFVTRFREALFHYSSLFDMLETIVPREDWERMLIEKEIFGREALNVIACEGCERVERPETYRQWQARILRAGFLQQSFERELVKRAIEKVRTSYHKDFVIDEDSQWLLQGWKGRIVYALSCWKPA
uniref:Scarecrow-like protein 9 n=1 Tax=Cajanus cajan TaxID=3821 RepID=A0A151RQW1_CAJCA|nr:Scarecrow-like protein 9 [Cajanus cajan]